MGCCFSSPPSLVAFLGTRVPPELPLRAECHGAAEQGLAPVEALELTMLHDVSSFINVRLAGEAHCWADPRRREKGHDTEE